jgi:nitrile hydratase
MSYWLWGRTELSSRRSHPNFVPLSARALPDAVFFVRKRGIVEAMIESAALGNEEEGYGRNAGSDLHYCRVTILMTEIWPDYVGSPRDGLRIEIFETWLARI